MERKPYHGHRQRLRDRFLKAGFAGFAPHEVVELLLTLAIPRRDVKPEAKALLRLPALGHKPLCRVTRSDVKRLISEIYRVRSAKTTELVYAVVSGVFAEAIDNGFTNENPCTGILKKVLPPKRKRETQKPDPFTKQELELVLSTAKRVLPDRLYLPIAVMAQTGMRLGETLAMHLDNLDISGAQYMITETVRKGRFGLPKTGRRLVDVPGNLVGELERYVLRLRKEAMKKGGVVGYLFEGVTERMIQRALERVCYVCHHHADGARKPCLCSKAARPSQHNNDCRYLRSLDSGRR